MVGYASSATKNGFKAMGASFAPVGETMNLQDLKVTGYNREEGFSGAFEIQMLDSIGRFILTSGRSLMTMDDLPP